MLFRKTGSANNITLFKITMRELFSRIRHKQLLTFRKKKSTKEFISIYKLMLMNSNVAIKTPKFEGTPAQSKSRVPSANSQGALGTI